MMIPEAEPHSKAFYNDSTDRWEESISPEYPQELDPFGELPLETEFLKPAVQKFRRFFLENLAPADGVGLPMAEGHVSVFLKRSDYSGREALIVEIQFKQPESTDIIRELIYRFYLYDNNVAIKKIVDFSIVLQDPLINAETILDQVFITELDLQRLEYAKQAVQRHPGLSRRK